MMHLNRKEQLVFSPCARLLNSVAIHLCLKKEEKIKEGRKRKKKLRQS